MVLVHCLMESQRTVRSISAGVEISQNQPNEDATGLTMIKQIVKTNMCVHHLDAF